MFVITVLLLFILIQSDNEYKCNLLQLLLLFYYNLQIYILRLQKFCLCFETGSLVVQDDIKFALTLRMTQTFDAPAAVCRARITGAHHLTGFMGCWIGSLMHAIRAGRQSRCSPAQIISVLYMKTQIMFFSHNLESLSFHFSTGNAFLPHSFF